MWAWLTTRAKGQEGEERALRYLQAQGLRLIERNYRVGGGPRRPAGEIDLIMRDRDEFVFVEVRARASADFGGAAASVGWAKQQRLRREAQRWLSANFGDRWPACRFDVCAVQPGGIDWIQGAF